MPRKTAYPAPVCLAAPQPGDFCCIPVPGGLGLGIEAGSWLAQSLEHVKSPRLRPYDHAEVYVGQADRAGPYGYTYSAYPDNGKKGKTGRRPLPCPPQFLPGSVWSSGIIRLTPAQRAGIVAWCVSHPCVTYSWLDYGAIALHALGVQAGWLHAYITGTEHYICSYYTDSAFSRGGGVHLFDDGRWEGYVTPLDLADLLLARAGPMGVG